MKKVLCMLVFCLMFGFALFGCCPEQNNGQNNDLNDNGNNDNNGNNTDNTDEYNKYNYELYYSYNDNMKGLEVYVFSIDGEYYTILMPGTNRLKTVEEITELQNSLPCPISKMKEILATYSIQDRSRVDIIIISYPVQESEIRNLDIDEEKERELRVLLGLREEDSEVTRVFINHPMPSSGVVYSKVGYEVQLEFLVFPEGVSYSSVNYISLNSDVVTVSQTGLVKCVGAGTAVVFVIVDGVSTSIPFSVTDE